MTIQVPVLAAALLISAAALPRSAGAAVPIKMPCAESSAKGKGMLPACSRFESQVTADIAKVVDQKMKCFYQQKDADVSRLTGDAATSCAQSPYKFESPCNLVHGEETAPSSVNSPNFSSCGQPSVYRGGKIYASGSVGTLERSYYHGAYIQALRGCRAAVMKELRTKHEFDGASCGSTPGTDFAANMRAMSAMGETLAKAGELSEANSIESACAPESAAGAGSGNSKHRIGVCHLAASRTYSNLMFSRIAQCEIFGRWARVWGNGYPRLTAAVSTDLINYCTEYSKQHSPTHTYGWCRAYCIHTKKPNEVEDAFNTCYRQNIARVFKTNIQQLFPENGSECGPLGGS